MRGESPDTFARFSPMGSLWTLHAIGQEEWREPAKGGAGKRGLLAVR